MKEQPSAPNTDNARRGLATIAFMKAQFDAGQDRLAMFQPFVEEAIRKYERDDIDLDGLRGKIKQLIGVSIPIEILKTLLKRAARKKLLNREGGRYLRTQNGSEDSDLSARIHELGISHMSLAQNLRQFATNHDEHINSDDDALEVMMRFLDTYHIGMVLDQPIQLRTSKQHRRVDIIVAKFIDSVVKKDPILAEILDDIIKGLIIYNALALRDIPGVKRHLEQLTLFLDTGVLLHALGYAGAAEKQATVEGIEAIRAAGARLRAFERTVNEIERILQVYESKLGSTEGIRSLHPTSLRYHFVQIKATPSDLRQEIELVRTKLANLGIRVREFPEHIAEYTEDERALADALRDPNRSPESDDYRVWHDVHAVAAVITFRKGARPNSIPNANYIFASDSRQTVLSATQWYRQYYPNGLEPITHFRSVTNAAWVLRPTESSTVPLRDLLTTCAAILQPTSKSWLRFIRHLDKLVTSGELDDDESIQILAQRFSCFDLSGFEAEEDVEAASVWEIVERTREEREARHRATLEEHEARHRSELEQHEVRYRTELEEREARHQTELEEREEQIKSSQQKITESEQAAAVARDETTAIKGRLETRVEVLSKCLAGGLYALVCILLFFGAIRTFPIEWSDSIPSNHILNYFSLCCLFLLNAVTLLSSFYPKFHTFNFYRISKLFLTRILRRLFLPRMK